MGLDPLRGARKQRIDVFVSDEKPSPSPNASESDGRWAGLETETSPTTLGVSFASRVWTFLTGWQNPAIWILLLGRLGTAVAFSLFFPFLSIYLTAIPAFRQWKRCGGHST